MCGVATSMMAHHGGQLGPLASDLILAHHGGRLGPLASNLILDLSKNLGERKFIKFIVWASTKLEIRKKVKLKNETKLEFNNVTCSHSLTIVWVRVQ